MIYGTTSGGIGRWGDMAKLEMLRVWTDGKDVVVVREAEHIPAALDRHYRVTGHTLRNGRWAEVPPTQVVRLRFNEGVRPVLASSLAAVKTPTWVGRAG